jgi:hypothetical protein
MVDGNRNDEPVVFVDAKVYSPKNGGSRYIWSKTFDLDRLKADLGTNVVTLKVVVPKKRRDGMTDDSRLVVFSPSEAKYLPKKKPAGGTSNPGQTSSDHIL